MSAVEFAMYSRRRTLLVLSASMLAACANRTEGEALAPTPAEEEGPFYPINTDIERDGAMLGPNVAATAALARAVTIPVIASGGVSSLADLMALGQTGVIAGAISGRAIYDGAIDIAAAIAALGV